MRAALSVCLCALLGVVFTTLVPPDAADQAAVTIAENGGVVVVLHDGQADTIQKLGNDDAEWAAVLAARDQNRMAYAGARNADGQPSDSAIHDNLVNPPDNAAG